MSLEWIQLSPIDLSTLNTGSSLLHHAAQFIALTGNSLLPHKQDDSHTNAAWLPHQRALVGNVIPGNQAFQVGLFFEDYSIQLLDDQNQVLKRIALEGKTAGLLLEELERAIIDIHGEVISLQPISHYELPDHPLANGAPFSKPQEAVLKELANYRSNAEVVFLNLVPHFEHASTNRTWPHHFDSGVYIPLTFDEQGEVSKSIGLGLAVADVEIEEYYWYINHWSKDHEPDYTKLPEIPLGRWHTQEWIGIVLPISWLWKEANQYEALMEFFKCGIEGTLDCLGVPEYKI